MMFVAISCLLLLPASVSAFVPQQSHQRRSPALQGKNNDRAHFERNLEDMMNNDWRAFRAKLVAQEKAEQQMDGKQKSHHHQKPRSPRSEPPRRVGPRRHQEPPPPPPPQDKVLQRQGQIGDIFAGAISSIFSASTAPTTGSSDQKSGDHRARQLIRPPSPASEATTPITRFKSTSSSVAPPKERMPPKKVVPPPQKKQQHQVVKEEHNIFDGDTIGGIEMGKIEDPFVSPAELPSLLEPKAVSIDKHRWAHEIPHVETGSVLLANEKLGGVFHQTVILIVQHCEKTGSVGVVINRPMKGDLAAVATGRESNLDLSLKLAFNSAPVTFGGPVMPEEYSIIHGFGEVEGSTKLCPGVFVGGSEELMQEVRTTRFNPRNALFVKGHAAWVPGQLSREVSKGVWYTAAVSRDFVLRYAGAPVTKNDDPSDLWSDIMSCLGGRYAEIANSYAGRGDNRMP